MLVGGLIGRLGSDPCVCGTADLGRRVLAAGVSWARLWVMGAVCCALCYVGYDCC